MPQIDQQYPSNAAAGHQSIANAFNEGQRTHYMGETVWRHRCESMVAQIANPRWFDEVEDCQNEVMYKLEPQGVTISAMPADNQELKSKTPTQTTHTLNFSEWAYTQCKWAKREINEKCDFDDYVSDVEEKIRREYDDYIERQALLRMAMVNPCFSDCGVKTGSASAPLKIDKSNSHQVPLMGDQVGKNKCDPRGYFLT